MSQYCTTDFTVVLSYKYIHLFKKFVAGNTSEENSNISSVIRICPL